MIRVCDLFCGSGVYREAMGIDWMKNRKSLTEAVPPAYSKYIGEQFLKRYLQEDKQK